MNCIRGSGNVPVIYTAHHASHDFHDYAARVALTPEQQIRFSDYGTADTLPHNGIVSIIAEHSRALGDLNRDPDDEGRYQTHDYGQPERHAIWLADQALTDHDKQQCDAKFYQPFHDKIIEYLAAQTRPVYVVAWDNTAHYTIGTDDSGQPVTMKPIILSNRGDDGTTIGSSEQVSCDPRLLELLAEALKPELAARDLPNDIFYNHVMRGGYICRQYSSLRNAAFLQHHNITQNVQSLQVEYDASITHDPVTLEPNQVAIDALQEAFAAALQAAIKTYESN